VRTEQEAATDTPPKDDGDVHIEAPGAEWTDDKYIHTMLCGAQVVIWDDGHTEPPGFNFYMLRDGAKATCLACRAADTKGVTR
jgi:hypothetical protein